MRAFIVALAAAFGLAAFLWNQSVAAAPSCMKREQAARVLAEGANETPVARGVLRTADGLARIIEVFATKDGSTFTVLITDETGRTCGVASGIDWEAIEWRKRGKHVPSSPS